MGKISTRTEYTFSQIGHADGKKAHEEMLNISNHQGNANQNHNKISPHTCQNGYRQKRTQIADVVMEFQLSCFKSKR